MNQIMLTSDDLLPIESENKIVEIENKLSELKELEKSLKEALLQEMVKRNIRKIDTSKLTISFIDETMKESFDSKALREDDRDLYDKYVKLNPVKAYVKIGVKKNGD